MTEHGNCQAALTLLAMRLMGDGWSEVSAKQAAEFVVRITEPSCWLRRFIVQRLDDEARSFAVTYLVPVLRAARAVTE